MKKILAYIEGNERVLYLLALLLALPAFFINLGLTPLLADEPTRALVALEMIISDNYVVPTINGDFYYNKPPLYNWILVALFKLTGDYSEWMIRIPSAVPLIFYAITIYYWLKKELDARVAFLTAIMFATCGRMLIYSSLLGHIDILYAWLVYVGFISLYRFARKEQWLALFAVSYTITALGFLMKGLPSIVFQGISLLVLFSYRKQFKKLFSWQHLVGGLFFLLIVGAYFYSYHQHNSLEQYFNTLWVESSKRTVAEKPWYETIAYLFLFPFDQFMHLFPWSVLVLFVFKKGFFKKMMAHPFLKFNFMMLAFNVIIYWLSPDTKPRYLFMLYPMLFSLLAYAWYAHRDTLKKARAFTEHLFLGILFLFALVAIAAPFWEVVKDVPNVMLKTALLLVGLSAIIYLYLRLKAQRMLLFGIALLLGRIGFDWFVLPYRHQTNSLEQRRNAAIEVGTITKGEVVQILPLSPMNHNISYYIERERMDFITREWERDRITTGRFYVATESQLKGKKYRHYHNFSTKHDNTPLILVKFEP